MQDLGFFSKSVNMADINTIWNQKNVFSKYVEMHFEKIFQSA